MDSKPTGAAIDTPNKRRLRIDDAPLCRSCGIPLLSIAEAKIGVHIRCVFEAEQKPSHHIPKPRYRSY